jgi:hypothetical protein
VWWVQGAHGATLARLSAGGTVVTKILALLLFSVFVAFGLFWQAIGGFAIDDAHMVATHFR